MSQWIDFKALRTKLRFADVLRHYEVELKAKTSGQAQGFCPLPSHDGEQHTPCFSAQLERGIWQCFGCHAKGNVLDFAILMDGLSPGKPSDVRTTALKLQQQFAIEDVFVERPKRSKATASKSASSKPDGKGERPQRPDLFRGKPTHVETQGKPTLPVRINQPLDFELKSLQPDHPYLLSRGYSLETIWRFGLGYCARGLMAGRIAIPMHDAEGRCVGYAGRLIDDSLVSAETPKYLFPASRERDGVLHEFRKTLVAYNAHRIQKPVDQKPVDRLVVVEGFPSVWWLTQAGITDVVALMGSSCSGEQAAVIVRKTTENAVVTVLPDGDEAGHRFAMSVFEQIGRHRSVRWIELGGNAQPTDFPVEQLKQILQMS